MFVLQVVAVQSIQFSVKCTFKNIFTSCVVALIVTGTNIIVRVCKKASSCSTLRGIFLWLHHKLHKLHVTLYVHSTLSARCPVYCCPSLYIYKFRHAKLTSSIDRNKSIVNSVINTKFLLYTHVLYNGPILW